MTNDFNAAVKANPKLVRCREGDPRACHCCGYFLGTRPAVMDGRAVWFCTRCPTPDDLLVRVDAIQSQWTVTEKVARQYGRKDNAPHYELPEVNNVGKGWRHRKGLGEI